jgi:hypothetical protein
VLLKAFVTSAVTLLPGQPDPHAHIAALATNTTRLAAGRQLLLQPGRGFLQALAAQLSAGCSTPRRCGCAGALRNVAISAEVGRGAWRGGVRVSVCALKRPRAQSQLANVLACSAAQQHGPVPALLNVTGPALRGFMCVCLVLVSEQPAPILNTHMAHTHQVSHTTC